MDLLEETPLVVVDSLLLAYYFITTIFVYFRRNFQPLKVRTISMTIAISTTIFLIRLVNIDVDQDCIDYPYITGFVNFQNVIFGTFFYSFYIALILSAYRLVTIFNFNSFLKRMETLSDKDFIDFKKSVSERVMIRKFFLFTFYSLIFGTVFCFGSILTGKLQCVADITNTTGFLSLIVVILVFVAFSIVFLWYFYKMRKELNDVYFLKQENLFIATFGILTWVLYLILAFEVTNPLVANMIFRIYFTIMHFVIVVYPLILTYKPPPSALKLNSKINNLDQIFAQDQLKQIFKEFLLKSLSIENYLFFEEVKELKNEVDLEKQVRHGHAIVAKYIIDDSPFQINIDHPIKTAIENSNDNDLAKNIANAQTFIFDILREDSFPRFLSSEEFKNWQKYKSDLEENLK